MTARPNANGYQAHVFNFQEQQCLLLSRKRRTRQRSQMTNQMTKPTYSVDLLAVS